MSSSPSLTKLVAFVEDGPWCGTRPPGRPRPGHLEALLNTRDEVMLNPQPLPPSPEIAAFLWQAVRLHQLSDALSGVKAGSAAEMLNSHANTIFDDYCGTIPWNILIWLLRHPPPPPPPYIDTLAQAANTILIAKGIGGDIGQKMQDAAGAEIKAQLGQVQVSARAA